MNHQEGSRPPAPIFTMKRPRQALLAHPNNQESPNTFQGSYQSKRPNNQQQQSSWQPQSASWQQQSSRQQPWQPNNQTWQDPNGNNNQMSTSSSYFGGSDQMDNQMYGQNQCASPSQSFHSNQNQFNQQQPQPWSNNPPGNQFGGGHSNQMSTQQSNYGNRNAATSSGGNAGRGNWQTNRNAGNNTGMQNNTWQPKNNKSMGMPSAAAGRPSYMNNNNTTRPMSQPGGSRIQGLDGGGSTGGPRKQGLDGGGTTGGLGFGSSPAKGFSAQGQANTPGKTAAKQNRPAPNNQGGGISGPDKSLRIITATIQGMKHWAKYTKHAPVMFEIFALVDSAVSTSKGAKEFKLKDDLDFTKCQFYEIDRDMPRVTRGQWYRFVGNYNNKGDIYRAVTIRAATSEERRGVKVNVGSSDRAMRAWVADLKET